MLSFNSSELSKSLISLPVDIIIIIINFAVDDRTNWSKYNVDHINNRLKYLCNISELSKEYRTLIRPYVYSTFVKLRKHFSEISWLVPDTFDWVNENDQIKKLVNYVCTNPNLCIAGGYPTLMFFNKDLNLNFTSDIDIYILKHNKKSIETLTDLFNNIFIMYGKIEYHIPASSSIINIKIDKIDRVVQIIFTKQQSPMHILSTYDNSHNRLCYYLGQTYATLDAIQTKQSLASTSYILKMNLIRIKKTYDLGLKINGLKLKLVDINNFFHMYPLPIFNFKYYEAHNPNDILDIFHPKPYTSIIKSYCDRYDSNYYVYNNVYLQSYNFSDYRSIDYTKCKIKSTLYEQTKFKYNMIRLQLNDIIINPIYAIVGKLFNKKFMYDHYFKISDQNMKDLNKILFDVSKIYYADSSKNMVTYISDNIIKITSNKCLWIDYNLECTIHVKIYFIEQICEHGNTFSMIYHPIYYKQN